MKVTSLSTKRKWDIQLVLNLHKKKLFLTQIVQNFSKKLNQICHFKHRRWKKSHPSQLIEVNFLYIPWNPLSIMRLTAYIIALRLRKPLNYHIFSCLVSQWLHYLKWSNNNLYKQWKISSPNNHSCLYLCLYYCKTEQAVKINLTNSFVSVLYEILNNVRKNILCQWFK